MHEAREGAAREWGTDAAGQAGEHRSENMGQELWFIAVGMAEGKDESRPTFQMVAPGLDEEFWMTEPNATNAETKP